MFQLVSEMILIHVLRRQILLGGLRFINKFTFDVIT